MKKLLLIIPIIIITSCATQKRCNDKFPCLTKDSTSVTYIKHDTIYTTEADDLLYQALFSCDSMGRVLFDSLVKIKDGKRVVVVVSGERGKALVNNALNIKASIPAEKFYKSFYEKEIFKLLNKTQVIKEVQPWYISLKWLLILVIAIILSLIAYKVIPKNRKQRTETGQG